MKYPSGYDFKCQMCGTCCHYGNDEYIKITAKEKSRILRHLGISAKSLLQHYAKIVNGDIFLRRKQYKCVFLIDNGCLIQSIKPSQCKTWPFWKENVFKNRFKGSILRKCKGIRMVSSDF